MRWPWSSEEKSPTGTTSKDISNQDDRQKDPLRPPGRKPIHWDESLNAIDWKHFTQPSVIIPTILLTATTLALIRAYKIFLRRIPNANHIRQEVFRKRSIFGKVTSVGDGDNFRLFHTPGGRLAGWGWLPFRKVPTKREELTSKTIHVRIAGIDAPELAHFGRPAQPFGQEALEFLTGYIKGRSVRAHIYRRDQYERVVGTVYMRKWGILRKDVGLEMLKRGLATVYEAKFGAEFGDREAEYRAAEQKAKERKVGMWAQQQQQSSTSILGKVFGGSSSGQETAFESPREYKTRMAHLEAEKGKTDASVSATKTLNEKAKVMTTKKESKKAASK